MRMPTFLRALERDMSGLTMPGFSAAEWDLAGGMTADMFAATIVDLTAADAVSRVDVDLNMGLNMDVAKLAMVPRN
jgi:hypothetical protein